MKYLRLSQTKRTMVDDEDFVWFNQWKWFFGLRGYAARNTGKRPGSGMTYMHRVINKTPAGLLTDHINGNKLDNRKSNLRSVTASVNTRNRPKLNAGKAKSRYVGVTWHPKIKKWEADITVNYKKIYLGVFASERAAANAYKNYKQKHDL